MTKRTNKKRCALVVSILFVFAVSFLATLFLKLGPELYFAHLHFEMREFVTPFIGPGYREDTGGWVDPTKFIEARRGAPDYDVGRGRTN